MVKKLLLYFLNITYLFFLSSFVWHGEAATPGP